MTADAELGQYTTLKFPTYAIAKLNKIGEFGVTRDDLDVTAHDTSGNADDWIAGQLHGGNLTVSGFLITSDTSGQMAAITDCLAGTKRTMTITLPNTDASTWVATAHCSSYKINPDLKGAIGITMTFKISGVPVWTV
jgi:hypothetical protein